MAENLRPELVAVVAMVDLATASERIGRTTAAALDRLDQQRAPDPTLATALSEAVHQARTAERALTAAQRALVEALVPLTDPPDGG